MLRTSIKRRDILVLLAGALCVLAPPAEAEEVRVGDAVSRALARSPDIGMSQERLEGAEAARLRSLGSFLPRVDFEESYSRTDQPVASFGGLLNQGRFTEQDFALERLNNPGSLDIFETRFRVSQPLFAGGKLVNRYKMALCEKRASQSELQAAREEVAFKTIQSYWGLSLAREQEKVAARAVETAQESLRQIELLHKEGTVVRSDLLSAMVTLAHFQDSLIKARGAVRVAERRLSIMIGESADGSWEVSGLDPPDPQEISGLDPEELLAQAKANRPDFALLKARYDAAKAGVRVAWADLLPAVGLEAGYSWYSPRFASDQEGSYVLGVGLQWNLFKGFQDRAGVREAQSNEAMARHHLKALEDRIALEIEEAVVGVTTGRESVLATEKSVGQAEENLRIVTQRYTEGLTTVVELEQAELALSRSRLERLSAVYDLRIAHARLKRAVGELLGPGGDGTSPEAYRTH